MEEKTLEERLGILKGQLKDGQATYFKIQGAIEVLEKLIEEDNPSEKEG